MQNIPQRKNMKFNMLLDYCIGRAAASIKEMRQEQDFEREAELNNHVHQLV